MDFYSGRYSILICIGCSVYIGIVSAAFNAFEISFRSAVLKGRGRGTKERRLSHGEMVDQRKIPRRFFPPLLTFREKGNHRMGESSLDLNTCDRVQSWRIISR